MISQKCRDAAAIALKKHYYEELLMTKNSVPPRYENYSWDGYAKAALEAAWKVWWEEVARNSGSSEDEGINHSP